MSEVVAQLARQDPARLVLFDSAPLLLTTESRALTQIAGQIVLVVRADQTPQHVVLEAMEALAESKIRGADPQPEHEAAARRLLLPLRQQPGERERRRRLSDAEGARHMNVKLSARLSRAGGLGLAILLCLLSLPAAAQTSGPITTQSLFFDQAGSAHRGRLPRGAGRGRLHG